MMCTVSKLESIKKMTALDMYLKSAVIFICILA